MEAEEIVQDALFKIWMRRETLAGINSLEHYLQRIARNILIDRRRAKAVQQKYYGQLIDTDRIEAQAEEDYLLKQYHLIARDAINRLSNRQREIFLLRHSGDLSLAEIAAQTRSTIPAVQKNLTRAVQFIKACLINNKDWTSLWIISLHLFF
jgi:RNA polymerase sigma factor (sigma-70 family)